MKMIKVSVLSVMLLGYIGMSLFTGLKASEYNSWILCAISVLAMGAALLTAVAIRQSK